MYKHHRRRDTPTNQRLKEEARLAQQCRKLAVLSHYGVEGKAKCVRCGFDDVRGLSIDHINGGGALHIRQVSNLYRWLLHNNFPEGFRTLCMNCQWIERSEKHQVRGNESQSQKVDRLLYEWQS